MARRLPSVAVGDIAAVGAVFPMAGRITEKGLFAGGALFLNRVLRPEYPMRIGPGIPARIRAEAAAAMFFGKQDFSALRADCPCDERLQARAAAVGFYGVL